MPTRPSQPAHRQVSHIVHCDRLEEAIGFQPDAGAATNSSFWLKCDQVIE